MLNNFFLRIVFWNQRKSKNICLTYGVPEIANSYEGNLPHTLYYFIQIYWHIYSKPLFDTTFVVRLCWIYLFILRKIFFVIFFAFQLGSGYRNRPLWGSKPIKMLYLQRFRSLIKKTFAAQNCIFRPNGVF